MRVLVWFNVLFGRKKNYCCTSFCTGRKLTEGEEYHSQVFKNKSRPEMISCRKSH